MSTDLNLKRSTTRVHAPPGGATTISFGYSEEKPNAKPVTAAAAKEAAAAPAPPAPAPVPVQEHGTLFMASNALGYTRFSISSTFSA
jgi:hypothetical protein